MPQHLVLLLEQPEPAAQRHDIIRTAIRRARRQTIRDVRLLHPPAQRVQRDPGVRRELLERRIRTGAAVTASRLNSDGNFLAMIDTLPVGNAHDNVNQTRADPSGRPLG